MLGDPRVPTIGLTGPSRAANADADHRAPWDPAPYQRALQECGACAVVLRPEDWRRGVNGLDGLLLSGGGDIAPDRYGRAAHSKTGRPDRARDEMELALTREALAAELPVLGICRGAQVLGVALGGDLIQDIGSEVAGALPHDNRGQHPVTIDPNSRLAGVLEASGASVNTSHHQANGQLGEGVRRAAWSADGVVEAIEWERAEFAVGVQWHPERAYGAEERQRRLFEAFAAAARCRGGAMGKGG